jgi:sialic acid synthase SpsE
MSGNHNGDIKRAFRILEVAQEAGADAVKLQTYRADTITFDHEAPEFTVKGGLWDGRRAPPKLVFHVQGHLHCYHLVLSFASPVAADPFDDATIPW